MLVIPEVQGNADVGAVDLSLRRLDIEDLIGSGFVQQWY
jgi:hypothetical protein